MYKYSPISKIIVKNFRNIGDAEISFDESPIVSLIGENEAGKTSIVKAFSVCALHATPRDQKDFIRDGSNGFGVQIELEDGSVVTRMKTPTLNYYHVKKADGTEWEANKLDNGVPLAVQEVMGMIEEPETKEFLQVRTYEDQLLFVVTPASTNYKVMYDALKVDQLTRAIKAGSKEANAIKASIDADEHGVSTLTASLRGIRTFDIEPLLNIKTRLTKEIDDIKALQRAAEIINRINQSKAELGALAELESANVSEINEVEARLVNTISKIRDNISNLNKVQSILKEIDTIEPIDVTSVTKLYDIVGRISSIESKRRAIGAYADIGNAEDIDETIIISLQNASNLVEIISDKKSRLFSAEIDDAKLIEQSDFDNIMKLQSLIARSERNSQLSTVLVQYDNYCKQVEDYIKSLGVDVEICPRCGESVVVDLDKYSSTN